MLPEKYRAFACWPREPGTVLAEVDLTKVQALRLRLAADGGGPFVVDAVRLVQIR